MRQKLYLLSQKWHLMKLSALLYSKYKLLNCPEINTKTLKSLEGKIPMDEAFAMLQQIDVICDSFFPLSNIASFVC